MQQLWSILDITFCVVGLHAAWQNTEHVACCSLHQIYFVLLCMTCPQVILLVYLCFYVDCRQTCKLSYKPCIKCPEVQLLKSKRPQFARSCSHYAEVKCFDTSYWTICERTAMIAFVIEHPNEVELQVGFVSINLHFLSLGFIRVSICTMQHMVYIYGFVLLLVFSSVTVTDLNLSIQHMHE